jgi:hypothetical protein
MSRSAIIRSAVLALGLLAAPAFAGYSYDTGMEVRVYPASSYAYGGVNSARRSSDTMQSISCNTYRGPSGGTLGSCNARDRNGVSASCTTVDPLAIDMMQSVGPSSVVFFMWDAGGTCSYLSITHGSAYTN